MTPTCSLYGKLPYLVGMSICTNYEILPWFTSNSHNALGYTVFNYTSLQQNEDKMLYSNAINTNQLLNYIFFFEKEKKARQCFQLLKITVMGLF